ncbi:MAG: DUF72 domain-containing protein [Bacteroidetes bacterium]|nr:MAG: DUF72 domain-containing protein [Bacteroidota bacterium]
MAKAKIFIGTSGWHYPHWKGVFYPPDLKEGDQFKYYTEFFDTVELNNPFYRLPTRKTFQGWEEKSPTDFVFSVKMSRFISHLKKLNVDKATIMQFLSHAAGLKKKQGPYLVQLPPRWKINMERLERFLKKLPPIHRYTFEFRNSSWYTDEVYELLRKYNCAFCIYELNGHLSPIVTTADFVYIRLHGPGAKYEGSYPQKTLTTWSKRAKVWQKSGLDVFIYFDNDTKGDAVLNAKSLKKIIARRRQEYQVPGT